MKILQKMCSAALAVTVMCGSFVVGGLTADAASGSFTPSSTNKTTTPSVLTLKTTAGQTLSADNKEIVLGSLYGSKGTTYGSIYVDVSTNSKNSSATYSYSDNAVFDIKKDSTTGRLRVIAKKTGTSALTIKVKAGNKEKSIKVNIKVLNNSDTIKKMDSKGTYDGFENSSNGATCWAAASNINIYSDWNCTKLKSVNFKSGNSTKASTTLPKSAKFYVCKDSSGHTILGTKISIKILDAKTKKYVYGYVNDSRVYINMPQIMPSLVYDNINANSAIAKCNGVSINNVTGKALYDHTKAVPIRISTARKIQAAQNVAQKYGFTVAIEDAYRPLSAQNAMATNLTSLCQKAQNAKLYGSASDKAKYKPVYTTLTKLPTTPTYYSIASDLTKRTDTWHGAYKSIPDNIGWFIASGNSSSSHQNGRAIDCTLASYVTHTKIKTQCQVQDLSSKAIVTNSRLKDNQGEKALNYLFTANGMEYLMSEWWHFEERISKDTVNGKSVTHTDSNLPNLGILKSS
ncbi:MAG: hypothetical protein IJ192_08905 [Clostridia bacterium]|nr:hypothetical protein [Clostridia bacterium]